MKTPSLFLPAGEAHWQHWAASADQAVAQPRWEEQGAPPMLPLLHEGKVTSPRTPVADSAAWQHSWPGQALYCQVSGLCVIMVLQRCLQSNDLRLGIYSIQSFMLKWLSLIQILNSVVVCNHTLCSHFLTWILFEQRWLYKCSANMEPVSKPVCPQLRFWEIIFFSAIDDIDVIMLWHNYFAVINH